MSIMVSVILEICDCTRYHQLVAHKTPSTEMLTHLSRPQQTLLLLLLPCCRPLQTNRDVERWWCTPEKLLQQTETSSADGRAYILRARKSVSFPGRAGAPAIIMARGKIRACARPGKQPERLVVRSELNGTKIDNRERIVTKTCVVIDSGYRLL